jgi:hypothetical protein
VKCHSIAAGVELGKNVAILDFVNLYGCEIPQHPS